jgi:hypothetical protein
MAAAEIASIALPIVGSILGELFASGDKKKQKALEDAALRIYGNASPPTLERLATELMSTGEWDAMPSDFGNKGARDEAIRRMAERGATGGWDDNARLTYEQGRQAAAAQEQRGRASVRQEAERRGLGGNAEVYGQLAAQQAGAGTASMGAMQASADAETRALQALMASGGMAQDAESADFGQRSAKATARDAIARWNAENAQRVAQYNNGLTQQEWGNKMDLKDRSYGATTRRADAYGQSADRTRQMFGGVGKAAGYGLNAYAQNSGGGASPAASFNPMQGNYGAIGSDAALEYWRKQGGR